MKLEWYQMAVLCTECGKDYVSNLDGYDNNGNLEDCTNHQKGLTMSISAKTVALATAIAKEHSKRVFVGECIISSNDDDHCNKGHEDCPTIHMDKNYNHYGCKWFDTDIICMDCYITGT